MIYSIGISFVSFRKSSTLYQFLSPLSYLSHRMSIIFINISKTIAEYIQLNPLCDCPQSHHHHPRFTFTRLQLRTIALTSPTQQ
eukprot:Awhi_evm1s5723